MFSFGQTGQSALRVAMARDDDLVRHRSVHHLFSFSVVLLTFSGAFGRFVWPVLYDMLPVLSSAGTPGGQRGLPLLWKASHRSSAPNVSSGVESRQTAVMDLLPPDKNCSELTLCPACGAATCLPTARQQPPLPGREGDLTAAPLHARCVPQGGEAAWRP